ncbi:MAG: RNA polymerase sigma factor [candidate division Zixibacteria bacterium]|nr:RNA polymerase sigma factor [candidate division Zixibacteria bacterium]
MSEKTGEEKGDLTVDSGSEAVVDRPLVKAAREGDKDAYGKLVLKYQKQVFRFILMISGRIDTTEDIVQEAFIKGYLALDDFDEGRPFYPWIATIARNLALNQIRKHEREKPISEMDQSLPESPASDFNPLENMIEKENDRRFIRAVMALPVQFRSVFILRTFEEMSYEKIAKCLNISAGTVDSRLYRAREKLLEMLKDAL